MRQAKGGSEDQKKMIAIAVFVLIAVGIFYFEYFYTGSPSMPATVAVSPPETPRTTGVVAGPAKTVSGRAAKPVATTSAALDPTLHMEAMLVSEQVEYEGSGRNIFSPNSAPPPVVIQKPIAPARLTNVVAPPPVPTGPPPPPPINMKFFGVETEASGKRVAFLLHDDTVYRASPGDVVVRRYRIISIEPKTIEVEDMQNNNKQTLPLLAN